MQQERSTAVTELTEAKLLLNSSVITDNVMRKSGALGDENDFNIPVTGEGNTDQLSGDMHLMSYNEDDHEGDKIRSVPQPPNPPPLKFRFASAGTRVRVDNPDQDESSVSSRKIKPVSFHNENVPSPQRSGNNYECIQQPDGRQQAGYRGRVKKKVFILHFKDIPDSNKRNPVLDLAVFLRGHDVDVTVDLFLQDTPPDNWLIWYENSIQQSNIVLCMITKDFIHNLTESNAVLGRTVYNMMNDPKKNIAFRAVFLNADKNMEYVPPAMQGSTCYHISSDSYNFEDEEFANLYAFLSGQNRVKIPQLGKMIVLPPKVGKFNRPLSGGNVAPTFDRNAQHSIPQSHHATYATALDVFDIKTDQASFVFTLLGGEATPVKSLHSHNRMFMQLARDLTAEWEPLGRMLGVSEASMYAIKRDHMYSVTEQAVQMFMQWLTKNGSKATLGALVTAVHNSGQHYWNLLDVLNKYAPQ